MELNTEIQFWKNKVDSLKFALSINPTDFGLLEELDLAESNLRELLDIKNSLKRD